MTKYSPSIEFEESQISIPQPAISTKMIAGGILNANKGYGKEIVSLYSENDLLKNFGKPTDINFQNWYNIRDFLKSGNEFKCVRAIPTNSHNSAIKLNGASHVTTNGWYVQGATLTNTLVKLYNPSVAEFNLENNFTTNSKLVVVNRHITTDQDLAVAVCSSADHYNEPMFYDEMETLRNFNQTQAPASPSKFEKYQIKRKSETVILTANTTFESSKDLTSELAIGDHVNDGTTNLTITAIDFGVTTADTTTITVNVTGNLSRRTVNNLTTITYLLGDWSVNDFVDGDIVGYDGSSWTVEQAMDAITVGKKYYVEMYGKVYQCDDMSSWYAKSDEKYKAVDANGDGKAEYAVKDIFDSSLLNSDNSIKSFKEIYKANLDFVDEYDLIDTTKLVKDNILVFVFKKNNANKWELVEQHLGSSVENARDDKNGSFYIGKIILDDSDYIYIKTGETNTYTATNVDAVITVANEDLRNIQIGEKIVYLEGVNRFIANIVDMSFGSDNTVITIDVAPTGVVTEITDEVSGKVSTNYNKYGNPRSTYYDDTPGTYHNSEGYSIQELIIYDQSPTNSAGDTITDYSDLSADDMNSSAEIFTDKDNVDVNLLLPFETIDEFGNHHQDKMASIAEVRADCYAIITPFDKELFLGNSDDKIVENLVREFGNQRANLYSGTFTKYSKYAGVNICSIKYYEDTYNNKFRWLSYAGDIARMIVKQDNTKGVWFPIAGSPDGYMNNHIKTAFIPKEEYREELNKNNINTMYINSSMNNPTLFSNLTSYRSDNLFKVLSYRLMLNKIEIFIKNNLFPQLFKFKTDGMIKRIKDLIEPFLNNIVIQDGLESAELIFPKDKNEPSNTVNLMIDLVPNGVVEHIKVKLQITEQGYTIEES
jgi:hypothetical protein